MKPNDNKTKITYKYKDNKNDKHTKRSFYVQTLHGKK
jgi:hypothetical protein